MENSRGKQSGAARRRLGTLLLLLICIAAFPAAAQAASFDVDDLGDADNGACNPGTCTLRDAINAANASGGLDTITFSTLGGGTISPATPLPTITDPVEIDGTTAAGFVGEPVIEISGALAPANSFGVELGAGSSSSRVEGLIINGWSNGAFAGGIRILDTTSITILGNYIGTDAGGGVAEANDVGIYTESDGTVIGGPLSSQRNVISGNTNTGIYIYEGLGQEVLGNNIGTDKTGTSPVPNGTGVYADGFGSGIELDLGRIDVAGNLISGNDVGVNISAGAGGAIEIEANYIGTDASGTYQIGNTSNGVELYDSADLTDNLISGNGEWGVYFEDGGSAQMSGNRIGTDMTGTGAVPNMEGGMEFRIGATGTVSTGDTVSHNDGPGIALWSAPAPTGNSFRSLSMTGNFEPGIDLGWDGVTANDPLDADSGPNGLQNFPVLSSAEVTPTETLVNGTFNSEPSSDYEIDFYASPSCHLSGHGQGTTFLAALPVTTDGSGNASISGFDLGALPAGQKHVTSTATNMTTGSTSEFSACVYAGPVVYDVNDDSDPGDGSCDPSPGECTLRDAILEANANPLENTITFSELGGGTVISPQSALPQITDPLVIDGESAIGWTAGNPMIVLDGSASVDPDPGLHVFSGSSPTTIQGLVMYGWENQAIEVEAGTTDTTVRGNFLGTNAAGTAAGPQPNTIGVSIGGSGTVVGGDTAADRNVISANTNAGVFMLGDGPGNRVIGNYIGTDRTGTADLGNVNFAGVYLFAGGSPAEIGGTAPGEGNLISGNANGITANGAGEAALRNNLIGTDAAGTGAIPNDQAGVRIEADSTGLEVNGGTVAFNGGDGLEVVGAGSNGIGFSGISTHSNGGLGVDLGGDGVTANDALDADTGANGLQNFPVINSAVTSGGSTTVSGTLNSLPSESFTIEVYSGTACDATGFGEGRTPLASAPVALGPSGQASFQLNVGALPAGQNQITALATRDLNGAVSEFSACVTAQPAVTPPILEPDNGRTAVSTPVSGVVRIKKPGGRYVVLKEDDVIPTGSLVDATKGVVRLTTETGNGESTQSAIFYAGIFKFQQSKGKTLVTLTLAGGKKNVCRPKRSKGRASVATAGLRSATASAAVSARKRSRNAVRRLWGKGKGRYKTKGKRGAATVRGTQWLTADRCDGTFFRVKQGVVTVKDFGKKGRKTLRRGGRYLARAR